MDSQIGDFSLEDRSYINCTYKLTKWRDSFNPFKMIRFHSTEYPEYFLMEVTGEYYLTTDAARKLFLISSVWITAHWQKEDRPVNSIRIKPKTIGRNPGFIICTTITNPTELVNYYAKIQRIEIDTVMMHFLLKYTNCGPEDFLISVLSANAEDRYFSSSKLHGVVTREVAGFQMASIWTPVDSARLKEQPLATQCFSFMLPFLVKFGCFGNIPGNRANWGLSTEATNGIASLKLVDFFSTSDCNVCMNQRQFRDTWSSVNASVLKSTFLTSEEVPPSYYKLSKYRHMAKCFPWLQSRAAFEELMQRVISSTDEWMTDRVHATTINSKPYNDFNFSMIAHTGDSDTESDCSTVDSADLDISMLTHDDPLVVSGVLRSECNTATKALYVSFNEWVSGWNKQMREFCSWFPFPVVNVSVEPVEHDMSALAAALACPCA